MDFKKLQKESHKIAVEKGFWNCNYCKGEGEIICENHNIDCPECDGKGKVKRNLSELLMLVVTELAEGCEALRHGNRQYIRLTKLGIDKLRKCEWKKDTFEDELADAVIRIMDLAESEGINLEWQIVKKLEFNKTRPEKHGKQF